MARSSKKSNSSCLAAPRRRGAPGLRLLSLPCPSRSTPPAAHGSPFPSPLPPLNRYESGYRAAPPTGTAVLKIVQLHVMGIGKAAGGAAPPPATRALGEGRSAGKAPRRHPPSCSHPGLAGSGRRSRSRCPGVRCRGRAARSCCPGRWRRRSGGASCARSVQSSCTRIRRAEPPAARSPAGAGSAFPKEGCRPAPLVASARRGPRWSRQRSRLLWVIAWHLRESPGSALQHRLRYRGERRRGWRLPSFSSISPCGIAPPVACSAVLLPAAGGGESGRARQRRAPI